MVDVAISCVVTNVVSSGVVGSDSEVVGESAGVVGGRDVAVLTPSDGQELPLP